MKQILFLFTILLFIHSYSDAQQSNNQIDKSVFTKSADIIKANIKSHIPKKADGPARTTITTKILDNGYVLESRLSQYWNGTDWDNSGFSIYTYTPEGLITEELNQLWNNGGWENSNRFLTTYYLNELVSLYEEQTWNGTDWENSFRYESLYDAENRVSEYNVYIWNGTSWNNMYKTIYTYFSAGNLETITDQYWDGTDWINSYKYSFQYNTNNDVSERLTEEWFENNWKNSILDVYTYNPQNQLGLVASFWWPDTTWKESVEIYYEYDNYGNINDMLTKFWESEELGLQNKYHTIYEYLPATSLKTKEENQEWNLQLEGWTNTWRSIYNYNTENILEGYLMDVWDGSGWITWSMENYSYDENGNLDTLLAQNWDGSQWVNSFRSIHTWTLVTSVRDENYFPLSDYSLKQNYPNPFNPSTTVNYSLPAESYVSIKVYDMTGSEMTSLVNELQQAGNHQLSFDGSNFTSGIYFLKMTAGKFNSTIKMLLLK